MSEKVYFVQVPGNTGRPTQTFQYSPILGHSSVWDLKYTFSKIY